MSCNRSVPTRTWFGRSAQLLRASDRIYACLQGQTDIADLLGVQLPGRAGSTQHVKLSSGYTMPLLGWGSSGAKDSQALHAVREAVKAGFRVRQANTGFVSKSFFASAHCMRSEIPFAFANTGFHTQPSLLPQLNMCGLRCCLLSLRIVLTSRRPEAGHALQHIDDAEMYGNEEAIGQGIHESIKAGEVKRQDLFIVSKLGNNHHDVEAVLPAVQASLSKLQLEYLDLYHIHW